MHRHSRVYTSADRQHTHNFVKVVLDDVLAYYKAVMEEAAGGQKGFFLRRMCLWSDGCAAQFKNRFQMSKLVELVTKDTRFGLEGAEHHFFASCHGKGPSDAVGGWTKTLLKRMEMEEGMIFNTPEEVHAYLNKEWEYTDRKEYQRKTGGNLLVCHSRTYHFVELVAQNKGVATTVPGIMAMHCFVVTGGKILMFPTSCTCVPCLAMQYDKCEKVASGERGKGKEVEMRAFTPSTQLVRTELCSRLVHGREELSKCEAGDWMLMRVPDEERQVFDDPRSSNWNCNGHFRLAQLLQGPEPPAKDGQRRGRARTRNGDGADIKVFYADEVEEEKEWRFGSEEICYGEGGGGARRWDGCECESGGCFKMHFWQAKVENVLIKIETKEEGQQRYTLTEEAKAEIAKLRE